jgi:hypothetical protein
MYYIPTFSNPRSSKIYPNWDFWFENIPSGNPASQWNFRPILKRTKPEDCNDSSRRPASRKRLIIGHRNLSKPRCLKIPQSCHCGTAKPFKIDNGRIYKVRNHFFVIWQFLHYILMYISTYVSTITYWWQNEKKKTTTTRHYITCAFENYPILLPKLGFVFE